MKYSLFLLLTLNLLRGQTLPPVPGTPQRVIITTDIGTDIDDAHAIAVALALRKLGYWNILAIITSNTLDKAASFVNLMLAHGGLTTTDVPIGAYKGTSPATQGCANDTTDNYNNFTLANFLTNSITPNVPNVSRTTFPTALPLIRQKLAAAPDVSVIYIVIGGFTDLYSLLLSPANDGGDGLTDGLTLFNTKVTKVIAQLSDYPSNFPYTASPVTKSPAGFNATCDITAIKYVFEHNGSIPIIGIPLQPTLRIGGCYDGSGIGCTSSLPTNSPARTASDHFKSLPGTSYTTGSGNAGAQAYDPNATYYALVELTTPSGSTGPYFTLSPNGSVVYTVAQPTSSTWNASGGLNHYFSIFTSNWTNEQSLMNTLLMNDYLPTSHTYTITTATTPAAAYTILQTTAVCGDVVEFAPGTWNQANGNLFRAVISGRVCTATSPLIIRAQDPNNRPTINARYVPTETLPGNYANSDLDRGWLQIKNSAYIIIDGLKIIGVVATNSTNSAGIRIIFSDHITVRNSYFQQNSNGIFQTSTNSVYEYNEFRGNGSYYDDQSHQFYDSGGDNLTLRYNTFLGNGTGPTEICCQKEDGSIIDNGGGQNIHTRSWHTYVYGNYFKDARDYEFDMATPLNCTLQAANGAPSGWCTNPVDTTQHLYFYGNSVIAAAVPQNGTKISVITGADGLGWNPVSPFIGFTTGHQKMHLFSNTFIANYLYGDYTPVGFNSPPNDSCCQYSLVQFNNQPGFSTQSLEYSNNILHFTGASGYKKSLFLVNSTNPWDVTGGSNWFNSNTINTCDTAFAGANGTCLLTTNIKGVAIAGAPPFNDLGALNLAPTSQYAFGSIDASVLPQSPFSPSAPNTYIARTVFTERGSLQFIVPAPLPPTIYVIPNSRFGGITIVIGGVVNH